MNNFYSKICHFQKSHHSPTQKRSVSYRQAVTLYRFQSEARSLYYSKEWYDEKQK